MINNGKDFEHEFKDSCEKQSLWLFRINDTYMKAKEYDSKAFVPQQPCDFIMHTESGLWLLELKTSVRSYISIERDGKNGQIKKHQYEQMHKYSCMNGQGRRFAGFVLQFDRGNEEQMTTWFLSVDGFYKFLDESEKHSLNRLDVLRYGGIQIPHKKAIKRYYYNVLKMIGETK